MGLTGKAAAARAGGERPKEPIVALAGNPNVGKSTIFNRLTGLRQHTGNWPGKTVSNAMGRFSCRGRSYLLTDIPGTYSLSANSAEEEIARDFVCFGEPGVVVVVADATCLERNLNLTLQIMEVSERVILCVNLLDEAGKKDIRVDLDRLSRRLGIPVVGTSARNGKGVDRLAEAVDAVCQGKLVLRPFYVRYSETAEQAVGLLEPAVAEALNGRLNSRWVSLRLLDGDEGLLNALRKHLGTDLTREEKVSRALEEARRVLTAAGLSRSLFREEVVTGIMDTCELIRAETVTFGRREYDRRDRRLDKILTARRTGIPIMLLLLCAVFWLTVAGANYPSEMLSRGLFALEEPLGRGLSALSAPDWLSGILADGVYRTLAWVVSVMLPPMAIFFPVFTLLEDSGYLPRIAFNLDHFFRKARAHGKQSLTMAMGFGCNAAGVVGCRIIDSPRERLIAILTNSFVPCNGRFPTLIAVILMFFAGTAGGAAGGALSALFLAGVVVLGVALTLLFSRLLSATVLKGMPSSFHLELPPYRRPRIGQVIVRSVLDRTLFVLRRAAAVAAPAGAVIWLMANLSPGGVSLLEQCAALLDPFARLIGMDGYILMAFILGFPANEIVVPIIIMSYTASGTLTDYQSLGELRALFAAHGWTWVTAVCVMLFSLLHWPCGTTCLTIRKEAGSWKWTLLAAALPTAAGIVLCLLVSGTARLLGL